MYGEGPMISQDGEGMLPKVCESLGLTKGVYFFEMISCRTFDHNYYPRQLRALNGVKDPQSFQVNQELEHSSIQFQMLR